MSANILKKNAAFFFAKYICDDINALIRSLKFHNELKEINIIHCVKSVRIRSYSGPHFSAFGLNTERCRVSLRIQSRCRKMQSRITPNTDTFHAVISVHKKKSKGDKENYIPITIFPNISKLYERCMYDQI